MTAVALVTGAASGLGLATTRQLLADGFHVVGVDLNEAQGREVFGSLGDHATFVTADVQREDAVSEAVQEATARGRLSVAVCCAGVGWPGRVVGKDGEAHDLALFQKIVGINLVGTFNTMRLAAAAMARNEPDEHGQRGLLIGTASVAAFDGQIGQAAYSASKGGVHAMTLPIARDLASKRIRCLCIAPGIFDTPMVAGLPDKVRASLAASIPNPSRLGDPGEYAQLVAYMVSAPYLNGETIRLDGSVRLAPR